MLIETITYLMMFVFVVHTVFLRSLATFPAQAVWAASRCPSQQAGGVYVLDNLTVIIVIYSHTSIAIIHICVLSPVSTTRVDGWPVSMTRQHGPLTRLVETGHLSTRAMLTGNGNWSPVDSAVNSGRQLWWWKPGFSVCVCVCVIQSVCTIKPKNQNGWNYNHQTCHRDSSSWVLANQLILDKRSGSEGHKVQNHIEGDWVASVSYALYWVPSISEKNSLPVIRFCGF